MTGFLIPVGDHAAVADRMRILLKDPQRAQAMGKAGAKLVRDRFSVDAFRTQLTELFALPT